MQQHNYLTLATLLGALLLTSSASAAREEQTEVSLHGGNVQVHVGVGHVYHPDRLHYTPRPRHGEHLHHCHSLNCHYHFTPYHGSHFNDHKPYPYYWERRRN